MGVNSFLLGTSLCTVYGQRPKVGSVEVNSFLLGTSLCTVYGQRPNVEYCGSQQLFAWYICLYSLWSETQCRVLWKQTGHLCVPMCSLVPCSVFYRPGPFTLVFCFPDHLSIFLKSALVLVNTVSHIGLKNKIGHPALCYSLLVQILVLHASGICVGSETCEIVYCDSE